MARKKNTPILTHTGLLCLAYRALEQDVRQCFLMGFADTFRISAEAAQMGVY